MTRTLALALSGLTMMAGLALADMPEGPWTMETLMRLYPDLTAETFGQIDTNADGQVDQAEFDAAVAAGLVPPMEG